jgi:hypothetical protein
MSNSETYRIIDIKSGGQRESWLVIYADGRIVEHVENDGHAAWRHGSNPYETLTDMAEVASLGSRHGKPLVEMVEAALAEMSQLGA